MMVPVCPLVAHVPNYDLTVETENEAHKTFDYMIMDKRIKGLDIRAIMSAYRGSVPSTV